MKQITAAFISALAITAVPTHGNARPYFIGYEFGEMAFNNFKRFAGELGIELDNKNTIRLAYVDVALTERHLSSNEASAVTGDNIEGDWRGLDLYYDLQLTDHVYISPSIGFHSTQYRHTVLEESTGTSSWTSGFAVSYKDNGVLGVDSAYWKFSLTFRHYFKPQETTVLGNSVVNENTFEVVPLIFVGFDVN